MRIFKFVLLLLVITACDTSTIATNQTLKGEWRYVGTFNEMLQRPCLICDDFDYDKALYRITYDTESIFTGRINLLIVKGVYKLGSSAEADYALTGTLAIEQMDILNKPPETEADGKFQTEFLKAKSFKLWKEDGGKYRQLSLDIGDNEFMLFAQTSQ